MLYNFVNAKHKAEQKKKKILKNSVQQKKKIEVIPVDARSVSGKILENLLKKKELKVFAELKAQKICVSVEMQNGTLYKDFMIYDELSVFLQDFRQK